MASVRAAVLTAGCRLNQAESDALSAWLRSRDMVIVQEPSEADVCYVNTCTVTAEADRSSRRLLRRAGELPSRPRVIALGCLAQRHPDQVRAMPGVVEVWTEPRKSRAVNGRVPDSGRSRALLKVQDGCDRGCAYCVVSRVRGEPRSVAPDAVETAVSELVERGYREVVLTGLNLGSYRHGRTGLAQLLGRLLRAGGDFRLRLGSLEPDTVTGELVEVFGEPRVCPHFHLALQSADDQLLAAMGRPCRFTEVRRLLEQILTVRPDACIGADIISGLPGETGASFLSACGRLADLPLAYLHPFTYSARAGTPAAEMADQVPRAEARARTGRLRRLSAEFGRRYVLRFLGTVRPGVVENTRQVMTDNYLRVRLSQPTTVAVRQYCEVRVNSYADAAALVPAGLAGRVVGELAVTAPGGPSPGAHYES